MLVTNILLSRKSYIPIIRSLVTVGNNSYDKSEEYYNIKIHVFMSKMTPTFRTLSTSVPHTATG